MAPQQSHQRIKLHLQLMSHWNEGIKEPSIHVKLPMAQKNKPRNE
jgi:hypothetical protein